MISGRKIRVLIVDDSIVVRKVLTQTLSREPDIEVVGTAHDAIAAAEGIQRLQPDVLTLDVEMPGMNGLEFLRRLMRTRPMPVIMISSVTQRSSRAAIEALAEGAVEVLAKPDGPYSIGEFQFTLAQKVRNAAAACLPRRRPAGYPVPPPPPSTPAPALKLIVIGASTGGTQAIEQVLRELPAQSPPIAIVQHIPAGFSKSFADRLNGVCSVAVREAVDGDLLCAGLALVAPGNLHMRLRRAGDCYRVSVGGGPPVCFQRPSVDVLFESVAESCAAGVAGIILTGMGSDGAAGMLRMHAAGVRTIAQDEHSCVVFGMPREAIRLGGVGEVLPLDRIAGRIIAALPSAHPALSSSRTSLPAR